MAKKKLEKKLEWYVYNYNCNADKIEVFNIFRHGGFKEYFDKWIKECKTKEELVEHLTSELRYYFWSKAEYELVIELTEDNRIFLNPWCGCREPEKVRIDITDDTSLNWKEFLEYHVSRQVYKNEAKIDIYDQVMFRFDDFMNYIWENK